MAIEIKRTVDGVATGTRSAAAVAGAAAPAAAGGEKAKLKIRNKPDPFIWGIYIAILIISIVELFSASSTEIQGGNVYGPLIRHAIFLGTGLALVLWLQNVPYIYFSKFAWPIAIFSVVLLLLSMWVGIDINGAQRALRIAGFTIQPPEMIKLAAVILLAKILGMNQKPGGISNRGVFMAGAVVLGLSDLSGARTYQHAADDGSEHRSDHHRRHRA